MKTTRDADTMRDADTARDADTMLSLPAEPRSLMLAPDHHRAERSSNLHLGIDEAGRGPVIGPLVLCGVWIRSELRSKLREMGVKDSKSFGSSEKGQQRRAELAEQIREIASCVVVLCIDAAEVSRRVRLGELNVLEQEIAETIMANGPQTRRIIADGARLFGVLRERHPQLRAFDRADENHPCVAAASIVAKVERDARYHSIVEPFESELGPIRGGGYVNDETASFLRAYVDRFGELPPETREAWGWSVLRALQRRLAGLPPIPEAEQLSLLASEAEP